MTGSLLQFLYIIHLWLSNKKVDVKNILLIMHNL